MFVVEKSHEENALSDEGIDGYVGLFPSFDLETGLIVKDRPSLVVDLYQKGLIPEPIVAINMSQDNINFTSTLTFGGYSTDGIRKMSVFNNPVSLLNLYEVDKGEFYYRIGTPVIEYSWGIIFDLPRSY